MNALLDYLRAFGDRAKELGTEPQNYLAGLLQSLPDRNSLQGAVKDPEFYKGLLGNTKEMAGGLLTGTLGAPVDIATMMMRPGGYNVPDKQVVGSSNHLAGLLGLDEGSAPYQVGNLLPTGPDDAMRYAGLLGTFAGAGAKTANKGLLEVAKKMDDAGVDRAKVWEETGWFKGPDKKWRFEIDDSKSRVAGKWPSREYATSPNKAADNVGELGRAFKHDDLYTAYPEAREIKYLGSYEWGPDVRMRKDLGTGQVVTGSAGGNFYPGRNTIDARGFDLNRQGAKSGVKSSTLHELQHAIQQREGFARGGSPGEFAAEVDNAPIKAALAELQKQNPHLVRLEKAAKAEKGLGRANKAYADALDELGWYEKQESIRQNLETLSPFEQYRRLAGEAEARATQARMNMNAAQRKQLPPWFSYDVPWDQLIIR